MKACSGPRLRWAAVAGESKIITTDIRAEITKIDAATCVILRSRLSPTGYRPATYDAARAIATRA